jgi:predicted dithiol-disulfide oxidoreductase (DUF899 family)
MTKIGNLPEVVSKAEWLAKRKELLKKEKELTHAHDRLATERRQMPMVKVEKTYTFTGSEGPRSLLDLFEGRPQLIVHHYMLRESLCTSCASSADTIGGLRQLHARNTTLAAVSWAPYETLQATSARMGWTFPWYSSAGSDFNYDFHATLDNRVAPVLFNFRSEDELATGPHPWAESRNGTQLPGISCFLRDGDDVYLTNSVFARGTEAFHANYPYLDLTVLGRQEDWEEPKGRAEPTERHMGGAKMKAPDEYGS